MPSSPCGKALVRRSEDGHAGGLPSGWTTCRVHAVSRCVFVHGRILVVRGGPGIACSRSAPRQDLGDDFQWRKVWELRESARLGSCLLLSLRCALHLHLPPFHNRSWTARSFMDFPLRKYKMSCLLVGRDGLPSDSGCRTYASQDKLRKWMRGRHQKLRERLSSTRTRITA